VVERRLVRERPRASRAFVAELEAALAPARPSRARPAAAAALTAALLVALVAVGGVGRAASTVVRVASVASHVAAPRKGPAPVASGGVTAGGDQYKPGFGFGDENHNHEGPPGLQPKETPTGAAAPPQMRKVAGGKARVIVTTVTVDEQASLRIAVVDADDAPLLITQSGSTVGKSSFSGKQTKTIRYTVLVPRPIQIVLRIPESLLDDGQLYRIRVIAIDPDGNRSTAYIPFVG
jgi:hypothetical protein